MKLSLLDGLKISVYGFVTVFMVLAVLMLIINVLAKVVAAIESKDEEVAVPEASPVAPVEVVEPEVDESEKEYVGEIKLIGVDEKTAACIMAIISERTQIPLENLIFKRIEFIQEGD